MCQPLLPPVDCHRGRVARGPSKIPELRVGAQQIIQVFEGVAKKTCADIPAFTNLYSTAIIIKEPLITLKESLRCGNFSYYDIYFYMVNCTNVNQCWDPLAYYLIKN